MPSCPVGSGTPAGHSPPLQEEVFSAIAIAMFYPFPSAYHPRPRSSAVIPLRPSEVQGSERMHDVQGA